MTATAALRIAPLARAEARDTALVAELADLVNEVYARAEAGLWREGAARTTAREVAELVGAGEIVAARRGAALAGCARLHHLDADTSEFGLLAASPAHRGTGVGSGLVAYVEQAARAGGRGTMQLELLVPRDRPHPSKVFLAEWYARLGYRAASTGRVEDSYPRLAPLLAVPCAFTVYRKRLTG